MSDSLTSLSLGHMTYFDWIFLSKLAMHLVSLPKGELGQNPWILRASCSVWKEGDGLERGRQRKIKEFGAGKYSLLDWSFLLTGLRQSNVLFSATCRMAQPLLLGVNVSKVPEGPHMCIFMRSVVSFQSQAISPLPTSELPWSKVVSCADTWTRLKKFSC